MDLGRLKGPQLATREVHIATLDACSSIKNPLDSTRNTLNGMKKLQCTTSSPWLPQQNSGPLITTTPGAA